jgi:hypothetical protein
MDGKQHAFEISGLGTAPFRFVDVFEKRGPIPTADGKAMVGYPGQPMGVCAHCHTGIAECCVIADVTGKTFIVGNVCVYKTGDKGIVDPVKRALNKKLCEKRHKKEAERIDNAKALFTNEALQTNLSNKPHPYKELADKGLKLIDYVKWMFANAGNKGKIEACKVVEQANEEINKAI